MVTGNVLVNEPSHVWTIGSIFPGFVDRLVPRTLGSHVPTQYKASETSVTGNQFFEAPRNTDNEIA
jgi:hypothetical protein